MSKQRYHNIKNALSQNEQDAARHHRDKSMIQNKINNLQSKSVSFDNESFHKSQEVNSKRKELADIKQQSLEMDKAILVAKSPKALMSEFLLDYSEYQQEVATIGESSNNFELQNDIENELTNLEETL
jgi:hypothetical protein